MLSVVMYAIITNVSFTMGYFLADTVPVWYLPKALLVDFLVSYALALGVNVPILPCLLKNSVHGIPIYLQLD